MNLLQVGLVNLYLLLLPTFHNLFLLHLLWFSYWAKVLCTVQVLNLNICPYMKNYPMAIRPRVGLLSRLIFVRNIYMLCWCPHCEHCVWSTNAWAKHLCFHHSGLPMFVEMKLECVTPEKSEDVLVALTPSKISTNVTLMKNNPLTSMF